MPGCGVGSRRRGLPRREAEADGDSELVGGEDGLEGLGHVPGLLADVDAALGVGPWPRP